MNAKREIKDLEDIRLLVDTFYSKVKNDEKLAPVFNERIQGDWQIHMEKMYKFWQTVLLGEHTYFGSPFTPHAMLPVDHSHFNAWITLFIETLDTLFTGEKTVEAQWRAEKMAEMFEYKIKHYQSNPG